MQAHSKRSGPPVLSVKNIPGMRIKGSKHKFAFFDRKLYVGATLSVNQTNAAFGGAMCSTSPGDRKGRSY